MRLGWERPGSLALRRVLTNRMREYFTYGSVGGAGVNPGSYPAANAGKARELCHCIQVNHGSVLRRGSAWSLDIPRHACITHHRYTRLDVSVLWMHQQTGWSPSLIL